MNPILRESLWKQFGASIDMLGNAIKLFPEENWHLKKKFFYMAYHCLVFLDYYLTIPPKDFSPKLPFTLTDPANIPDDAIDDVVPDRIYSKGELIDYLQSSREKCRELISSLTHENITAHWIDKPDDLAAPGTLNYSVFEILLYNMKHVQHHAAQLNLLLRQEINNAPEWVMHAEDELL